MCGIAGIRSFDAPPPSHLALEAMAQLLAHRGPDDVGFWREGALGFAHTRLSIIDVAGSSQPMASPDGRWHLVFNGEIFNFRELRDGLAARSYPFRTQGDTEVILAGLVEHGIEFITRLRGQFAFAAHDSLTATTHLVRDRLGVLPLYFSLDARRLAFASEPKAIFAGTGDALEVDHASLDAYLRGRSVPAPFTLFAGIRKVQPGHRIEITPNGVARVRRYWALPAPDPRSTWTPDSAVNAVDDAVRAAVSSSMVADVPVGAYLSGGVDSSLIVAMMSEIREGAGVATFSAGFGDPRHDELPWARRVSKYLSTEHHEVQVCPDDFEKLWSQLTWHRDAPVSEPADIAVFRLAELAREHVKVVLSGEGGDELFAGYPKYRLARLLQAADLVPGGVRSRLAALVDHRIPAAGARARIAVRAAGARTEEDRFSTWFAPFTPAERARLLAGTESHPQAEADGPRRDVIGRMLAADLQNWLPDNLLERGDRMSMAASLELRPPLLDHRLVELAFKLPSSVKMHGRTTKWALKEVARRYLPGDVVDRPKVGFKVPLDQWFRSGLRDTAWERLTGRESFVAEVLDRSAVEDLLRRHESGRFNEESRIWTLMSLEVWHETFFRSVSSHPADVPVGCGINPLASEESNAAPGRDC